MPLIPLRPLLETVDKYHFAQGAFNVNAVAQAKAAIEVQKDKKHSPCTFAGAVPGIPLQSFVGNQLSHRDALFIKAVGVSGLLIGVADNQDVDRLQVGREVKFLPQNIGIEVAYPHRSKTQLRGLKVF